MTKLLRRLYWNARIVGDDEHGYSVSGGVGHRHRALWAMRRETLLSVLVEQGLHNA